MLPRCPPAGTGTGHHLLPDVPQTGLSPGAHVQLAAAAPKRGSDTGGFTFPCYGLAELGPHHKPAALWRGWRGSRSQNAPAVPPSRLPRFENHGRARGTLSCSAPIHFPTRRAGNPAGLESPFQPLSFSEPLQLGLFGLPRMGHEKGTEYKWGNGHEFFRTLSNS